MTKLSLRQAAAAFSVSRTTLTKHLNCGKISGLRDDAGQWQIDPAELIRVYKPRASQSRTSPAQSVQPMLENGDTTRLPEPALANLAVRLAEAEAKLAAECEKTTLLERHLDDLRRLLPSPDPSAPPPRRRWWPW